MDNPAGDRWIVIPNWDKFQHYKDREPAWIKVYLELNSRDEWLDLTDADRGLLVVLWVEFARSRGRLKTASVPARDRQKSRNRSYDRLVQAGFIELSASPRARREEVREREREETPKSPFTENGLLSCPRCGVEYKTQLRLNEHLELVHDEQPPP